MNHMTTMMPAPAPGLQLLFYRRAAKGDYSLPEQFGIKDDDGLRFAFFAGLDAERARIRRSNQAARFVYRGVDEKGVFVEIALGAAQPLAVQGGPMPHDDIVRYRDQAQRATQDLFRQSFTIAAATPAQTGEKTNPALETVVGMGDYRAYKAGEKQRAIHAALVKQNGGKPLGPGLPDVSHIHAMLDQQVNELALEKTARRINLFHVMDRHGAEMFGTDKTLKRDMQRAVLAEEYLQQAFSPAPEGPFDSKRRRAQARKVLGNRTVALFLAARKPHRAKNSVFPLLQDYDLLANRLEQRSGIANLTRAAREQVLSMCRRYAAPPEGALAAMPGFARDMRDAALKVHTLIVTDLFSAPELRVKYAL